MNFNSYRSELVARELDTNTINKTLKLIKTFEDFLQKYEKTTKDASFKELNFFVSFLEESGNLSYFNLLEILRYLMFIKNEQLTLDLFDVIDGADLMHVLSDKIIEKFGEEKRNEVFAGIKLPKILLDNKEKPIITQKVMERMDALIDKHPRQEIMGSGLHRLQKDGLNRLRKKFLEEKNLDTYLKNQRNNSLKRFEQLAKEGALFFTQPVDEQVLEYIRKNPTIEYGVREGDKIIISKIPYNTKLFLNETNERLKRYYYCHCPWVRESLKKGDILISPTFCHCSSGWYKQKWDTIFDQPVKVDLIDSVLNGAMQCKFAVHIPKKFMDTLKE
ncbi:MAG: hypothetical protein FK730_09175 [Asgard group archaeon]|nr:hypothetical protein [Asgard group archaeon]